MTLDRIRELTAMVEWGAWEAIGTVAAVSVALWQSGAAARRDRERDRAKLMAVHFILESGHDAMKRQLARLSSGEASPIIQAAGIVKSGGLDELNAAISAFSVADAPDPDSVDVLIAARLAMREANRALESIAKGDPAAVALFGKATDSMGLALRKAAGLAGLDAGET